ncbi:MAG TPA: four helix bundle protein [Dehalococcoidia bacterium]|nr:four helix bundle protein [Dehalococcoidia bacterium]
MDGTATLNSPGPWTFLWALRNELEYHLLLACDVGYLDQANWAELTERTIEVKRMLAAFLKTLRAAA